MPPLTRRDMLPLLASGGLAACTMVPPASPPEMAQDGDAALTVRAVARGWHTDIGVPVAEMRGPLLHLARDFPGASHLLFGFGERAYWTMPRPTTLDMLLALLPGPGVILVTGLRTAPDEAFGTQDCISLAVSQRGLDRICDFLWAEFEKDEKGLPRYLTGGPYPGSLFYASGRGYGASFTCNTWTAEALRAGGLPVDPSGVLFAGQLMARLSRIAAGQQDRPRA